jgi:hypothetical protein
MTNDEYFRLMGTLVVNLQSLEFALRGFLYNEETGWQNGLNPTAFLDDVKEGDVGGGSRERNEIASLRSQ